jgi:hypothetical protein
LAKHTAAYKLGMEDVECLLLRFSRNKIQHPSNKAIAKLVKVIRLPSSAAPVSGANCLRLGRSSNLACHEGAALGGVAGLTMPRTFESTMMSPRIRSLPVPDTNKIHGYT